MQERQRQWHSMENLFTSQLFLAIQRASLKTISNLDARRAATQFPLTRNFQITENLLKSSFSRAILDI